MSSTPRSKTSSSSPGERWLVVSRAPKSALHFDIVIASSRLDAELIVSGARSRRNTPYHLKASHPIALSAPEVNEILNAMTFKSALDIMKRFALNTQTL